MPLDASFWSRLKKLYEILTVDLNNDFRQLEPEKVKLKMQKRVSRINVELKTLFKKHSPP